MSATLVFTKSNVTIETESDEPILTLAEKNGVKLDSLCRQGLCGTCKIKKTEGTVEMKNAFALQPGEEQQGFILACIGRAKGKVVIDA